MSAVVVSQSELKQEKGGVALSDAVDLSDSDAAAKSGARFVQCSPSFVVAMSGPHRSMHA